MGDGSAVRCHPGSERGGGNFQCETGIRGDFSLESLTVDGHVKKELCVQPFASEYHVFTGGRFGRAGIRKSR